MSLESWLSIVPLRSKSAAHLLRSEYPPLLTIASRRDYVSTAPGKHAASAFLTSRLILILLR
jgi:hypothetical protein